MTPSLDKKSRLNRKLANLLAAICLVAVGFTLLLVWFCISRKSFTIGHTNSRFLVQNISKTMGLSNFDTNAIFFNVGWEDPTSRISSGRSYGVHVGHLVFEWDTYYAPKGFP